MKHFTQNNETGLSLEDLIPGGKTYKNYEVKMPEQLQWWGDRVLYIQGDSIIEILPAEKQDERLLVTKKVLNIGLSANGKDELSDLKGVSFPYPGNPTICVKRKNEIYLYNYADKKVLLSLSIPEGAKNIDFSKDGRIVAYTKENNLFVFSGSGKEQTVTTEEDKGIVSGQSVHRDEFGIKKGTYWSPDGSLLAFYRMDETMVDDYPLVDISGRIAKLKNIKYPMAGTKSHHVTIGVYNPLTEQSVYLETGMPQDKYLTNITWSPDGKNIYVAELNRAQDTCKLIRYNVQTGKREAILFEETHPKYVMPDTPIMFMKSDSRQFIWLSKRDGFNHIYLYDTDGNMLRQLTSGSWEVVSIEGFDEKSEKLYYTSTETSPVEQHSYQLDMKNGKRIRLSKEQGVHISVLSKSGKYIFDSYSSQFNPGKVALTETKSNKSRLIYEAKNPYANKQLPEIVLGTIKADDATTDLYYRMVKPIDFDPNKKYPVIVYVYGGPSVQMVTNSWMGKVRGWDIYMAQKGYIVFTLDSRGTPMRGIDFENITHRRLGVIETLDQMKGVEYLKSLPFVDIERLGVHGWSYGGFMTLNLMLRYPDTFKVGVAGGAVTDWKYYEVMYGERYMGTPENNTEGYAETSMLNKAGNLKGRLLLIHDDEDPTVVVQHSMQFLKSSVKAGVHPDYFVYPGHGHNVTGKDRIHLHEHITRYFEDFLK